MRCIAAGIHVRYYSMWALRASWRQRQGVKGKATTEPSKLPTYRSLASLPLPHRGVNDHFTISLLSSVSHALKWNCSHASVFFVIVLCNPHCLSPRAYAQRILRNSPHLNPPQKWMKLILVFLPTQSILPCSYFGHVWPPQLVSGCEKSLG